MNEIKVSVIVPAYNVENFISDCLDSLVNQTLEELEIIVINDGSVDSTSAIIKHYALKYPYKIVFIDSENIGPGLSRNKGLNIARGKYIGFVDSDDWVELDMYETLYNEAEKGYEVVICNNVRKTSIDSTDTKIINPYPKQMPITKEDFIKVMFYNAGPWNKIFSSELLRKVGFQFPSCFYEDIGYIPTVITYAEKIHHIQKVLYYWRLNENSITGLQNVSLRTLDKIEAFKFALAHCNPQYKELFIYALAERALYDMSVDWLSSFRWLFYQYVRSLLPLSKEVLYKYNLIKNENYQKFLSMDLMPQTLHVMDIGIKSIAAETYIEHLRSLGCDFEVKIWTEDNFDFFDVEVVQHAYINGNYTFVNDYAKLVVLYQYGGIVIDSCVQVNIGFANILWENTVLGAVAPDKLHTHIMASKPYSRIFIDMIATYRFSTYFNEELPLADRLVDYIKAVSNSKVLGVSQSIGYLNLRIEPPSVFLVRMDPTINQFSIKETYEFYEEYKLFCVKELLSYKNNHWNMKKMLKNTEEKLKELENATFWRITKPLRVIIKTLRQIFKGDK